MRAFITGVLGQDGYYLARALLEEGHEVWGMVRAQSQVEGRVEAFKRELPGVLICYGDMMDAGSLRQCLDAARPDWVFNLAALSYVPTSWAQPELVFNVNALGFIRLLEAVRQTVPEAHVVQASSSEMYGSCGRVPLTEESPMRPRSVYGLSKLMAHRACEIYRRSYGMRVSSMIGFNHESPRRAPHFVTRRITLWVAEVAENPATPPLELGNVQAQRDWGYAEDYMRGFILAAKQDRGDDYVLATGECHTVLEFLEEACACASVQPSFVIMPERKRPWDVNRLVGDATKARERLGWEPKVRFKELVRMMVEADLARESVHA